MPGLITFARSAFRFQCTNRSTLLPNPASHRIQTLVPRHWLSSAAARPARKVASSDNENDDVDDDYAMAIIHGGLNMLWFLHKAAFLPHVAQRVLKRMLGDLNPAPRPESPEQGGYTMQLRMDNMRDVTNSGWVVEDAHNMLEDGGVRRRIIAFVGRYSSGKSYVMNQLLAIEKRKKEFSALRGQGFAPAKAMIAVGRQPETSGIGFVLDHDRWFLDTEGALAPATLKTTTSYETTCAELSLRRSKQVLIERVINRLADKIVIVIDRITDDDQQRIADLVHSKDANNVPVIVVCNFRDGPRDEKLIQQLETTLCATKTKVSLVGNHDILRDNEPDVWTSSWGTDKAVKIFALWQDCMASGAEASSLSSELLQADSSKDAALNTATLIALHNALGGDDMRTLPESSKNYATVSPMLRAANEIRNVLEDVVDFDDRPQHVPVCDPVIQKQTARDRGLRLVFFGDKIVTPRRYNRQGGFDQVGIKHSQFKKDQEVVWEIAAEGSELFVGVDKLVTGNAYTKVWLEEENTKGNDLEWHVIQKAKVWSDGKPDEESGVERHACFAIPGKYCISDEESVVMDKGIVRFSSFKRHSKHNNSSADSLN